MGGYRKGSGRSKSGYYKGIYCGSTYELCWVIYNLDHNIQFKPFPHSLKKDDLTYIPDFLIDNTIYEMKGYYTDSVKRKKELAESFGYEVKILYKEDLQYAFDYVKEKYKTTNFQILFDSYKPSYEYKCCFCNKTYFSDRKKKTEQYCSKYCSGKARKAINGISNEVREKISCSLKGRKFNKKKPISRKKHSENGKQNISNAMKKMWNKKKRQSSSDLGYLTFTQEDAGLNPVCRTNKKQDARHDT